MRGLVSPFCVEQRILCRTSANPTWSHHGMMESMLATKLNTLPWSVSLAMACWAKQSSPLSVLAIAVHQLHFGWKFVRGKAHSDLWLGNALLVSFVIALVLMRQLLLNYGGEKTRAGTTTTPSDVSTATKIWSWPTTGNRKDQVTKLPTAGELKWDAMRFHCRFEWPA